ncbi:MAG TPA: hypothetical protein VFA85_05570 [Terriglobales bacterium]|nr:hypothetical protein [Terriglobales bacterium]
MSNVKNPTEKKQLSLQRDRRNTYREHNKSSRKNIRRGKQRQHMDERRKTNELIARVIGPVNDDEAADIELAVRSKTAESRWYGFKKIPDKPLAIVLERKGKRKRRTPK